mgnify:CR=1 FL=1
MSLTKLGRPIFKGRIGAIEKYDNGAEEIQRAVLARLLRAAENTEWGRLFGYAQMKGYEDFAQKVPVNTYEELKAWYQMSGMPLKKFFNTSGLLYKSMELKDKLPAMSEEEQLKLLATDGMLVKRPLVIGKDFVLVGFKESEWSEKLI